MLKASLSILLLFIFAVTVTLADDELPHRNLSIAGVAFYDENNNGIMDQNESGLKNFTIMLQRHAMIAASIKTNESGYYTFDELIPGTYTINISFPLGWGFFDSKNEFISSSKIIAIFQNVSRQNIAIIPLPHAPQIEDIERGSSLPKSHESAYYNEEVEERSAKAPIGYYSFAHYKEEVGELSIQHGWLQKGNDYYDKKSYEQALYCYNNAIEFDPRDAEAWYNKGNALFKLNRHEEALNAYGKSIDINPNYVKALKNREIVLQKLGRSR